MRTLSIILLATVNAAAQTSTSEKPKLFEEMPESVWREMQPALDDHENAQARRLGYRVMTGQSYTEMRIPRPISVEQLVRYASILKLSEAQFLQFQALHKKYIDDDWAYREQYIQPVVDLSAEYSKRRNSEVASHELSEIYVTLAELRTTAVNALLEGEDRLFSNLIPFLTDEQIAGLERAKYARIRDRWIVFFRGSPGTNIDLTMAVSLMKSNAFDMQPLDPIQFDQDSLQYEKSLAEALVQATDVHFANIREASPIRAEMQEFANTTIARQRDGEVVDEAEFVSQYTAIKAGLLPLNDRRHLANRRIHDLHCEFLDHVEAQLPEVTAKELIHWFRKAAYPIVYPDPFDAESAFESALAIMSLDIEQHTVLDAMAMNYIQQRDLLSSKMVKEYLDWHAFVERRAGYKEEPYQQYRKTMLRLQLQRKENAAQAIAVLTSTLNEAQQRQMQGVLGKYDQSAGSFDPKRSRLGQEGLQWPGPWD